MRALLSGRNCTSDPWKYMPDTRNGTSKPPQSAPSGKGTRCCQIDQDIQSEFLIRIQVKPISESRLETAEKNGQSGNKKPMKLT